MKPNKFAGFTIIETMLFLAITGLLVVGVLVGTGTSINVQRYHDSIASLQSILQQQYSEVANVSNESYANVCGAISDVPRGQSDCVILGRFITTDSHTLQIKSVTGQIPASFSGTTDDVAAIQEYNIQVSLVNNEEYDLEWGASLVDDEDKDAVFSMLVLRSPNSGIIRTFINPTEKTDDGAIQDLVVATALDQSVNVCINSNGLFTGGRSAVLVMPNTSSASGVEVKGDGSSGC